MRPPPAGAKSIPFRVSGFIYDFGFTDVPTLTMKSHPTAPTLTGKLLM